MTHVVVNLPFRYNVLQRCDFQPNPSQQFDPASPVLRSPQQTGKSLPTVTTNVRRPNQGNVLEPNGNRNSAMKSSTHVSNQEPRAIRNTMTATKKEDLTATAIVPPSADDGKVDASAHIQSAGGPPLQSGSETPRAFRPVRFAFGLATTTVGMSAFLLVGIRIMELRALAGDFVLPLVGITVLGGIILLGGGFGLMATAAAGFDEREFEQTVE
jgi:hypothetical protein